jgi:hypothetical protein
VFYFQKLLNMAMAGIDRTSVISTVTTIGFAILLVGFLVGLYQAALRGGDLQALAVTAIKYLVVAMIIANWPSVFRSVNGSFDTVANFIGNSSGSGDMFLAWMTDLQQQANNNPGLTFFGVINGDIPGAIPVLLLLLAYLVYALAMIVFCFFYTLFGSVLYVLGPLVLALIPISGIGQLGKTYAVNLMIWNAWGILYAIFGALITAIQVNRVNDILGHGFLGFLEGAPDSLILGLVSIFYALSVAMIPFIARKIISGDVGSSAFALVRAGAAAAGAGLAAVSGFASGAGSASAAGAGAAGGGGAGSSSTTLTLASSTPPPTPAMSMADFVRSGMSGVMQSNTSPVSPTQRSGSGGGSSGSGDGSAASATSRARSGTAYRPHSVTQVITFNAAKALGRAVGRNNADDN